MFANNQKRVEESSHVIAVAATFTTELVEESLQFWMDQLGIQFSIRFAPYNQVFQQLLDPASILFRTENGLNVLLVRLEDWWRGAGELEGADAIDDVQRRLERHVEDLLTALKGAAEHSGVPQLLCLCPASRQHQEDPVAAECLSRLEGQVTAALADSAGIYAVSSAELLALYPVANYEDREADRIGHVPYTQELFDALGTMIARRYYGIHAAPAKVIVLDCDNTLWRGICGEDGSLGVSVDSACQFLQKYLIAQRDAGTVLALCTKNNEEDVWEVFDENPDMILRRDHIVAWRINWQPKSENIRSLSEELNLGLDSFVYLDDSALECAEVEARCPQVLTLQLPETETEVARLVSHIWLFDHLKVTAEDRQRSELYAREVRREQLRKQSLSLDTFLAALELEIDIAHMEDKDIPRVSQLTQRTNQFNFTSMRLTQSELEHRCRSGSLECLVLNLRDRFGDYGLVGIALFAARNGWLEVDNVLLSCRALGRRVEHRFFSWLDNIAMQRNLQGVRLHFTPSGKNQPAQEFLNSISEMQGDAAGVNEFPCGRITELCDAAGVTGEAGNEIQADVTAPAGSAPRGEAQTMTRILRRIATELSDPRSISREIAAWKLVQHRDESGYVAPRTEFEESLAALWARYLSFDRVGIHDNFFDLGGHSLIAMQIVFKIQETFGVDLALETFLESESLGDLAERLEAMLLGQADQDDLLQLIEEIEMSTDASTSTSQVVHFSRRHV